MQTSTISLIVSAMAVIIAVISLLRRPQQNIIQPDKINTTPLRLQAYERLVLLTERIALPNLISRLNQPGISALEMKIILTENIKHEFEYNSTQQLYVNQSGWDAVSNLKEQNIMLINRVAASLPLNASAADLNKKIMELVLAQPDGALHDLVLKELNHEAKKLM
ncbi:MAG TPA: hypothetical protein PK695_06280 [Chitinophagaceae bacterium]|jgi:hypothetical protein|nr:MAG: hypothetical protein BWZ05_00675 [Bacteroidetes bacterium ADurb.BinA245]HMX77071.1 hypothetical protein [Chitinophagaceae bacterium]HNA19757.1 hypothetical protein [Chitinophagaceae bacterium]HNF37371.1 hypothetical protein [Chitinophagaceae bacterium]HNF46382.1 hypothetical protein [Chitinophagaceae bacterium]